MSKRGPVTQKEIDFVKKNAHAMTLEELAKQLDRTIATTQKLVNEHAPPSPAATAVEIEHHGIRQELRNSEKWKALGREFDDQELRFFEEEYVAMMSQFKGDVLHTEVAQIFDAIKLEILKTRNMTARKKALQEIASFEATLDAFLSKFQNPRDMTEADKTEVFDLKTNINRAKQLEQDKTREWTLLQERVEKIRASLKSNRDQRVKEIESKGVDFISVIRALQNRDVQTMKSRELQLVRMAGRKELAELGESHQYEDGTVDSPILSADSVGDEEDTSDDE